MNYNLELEKAIERIKQENAKLVCIQLPDGLKPKAKIIIWAGSCFGACDYPDLGKQGVDLLIQWGHSEF